MNINFDNQNYSCPCVFQGELVELNRKLNNLVPTTINSPTYYDCVGTTIYWLPLNPYSYIDNAGRLKFSFKQVSTLTTLPVVLQFSYGCINQSFILRKADGSAVTNADITANTEYTATLSVCNCKNVLTLVETTTGA